MTTRVLASLLAAACGTFLVLPAVAQDKPKHEAPAAKDGTTVEKDAAAAKDAKPAAALCPVTGKPIDRQFVARFRGKRVYCADAAALAKFNADPAEYAEAASKQWEALPTWRVQVLCPVTGETVSTKIFVEGKDDDIYFATEEAKAKWLKDSKPFESKLADCFTFQTNCLICGHDIKPSLSETIDGQKVYFGCAGCIDAVKEDKAASLKKLAAQMKANREAFEKARKKS